MGKDSFGRHQKKVLALVLAFACAFTMFAGAAFTDQADINSSNVEAVDTLVALGVINGYTDGSFQPNGTITRAEMAKMIYVLRTGSDNADAYKESSTKFVDLNTSKSSWAAGYIKYCEALGIIAGKSATKFDPDATVTGEEAAKMLLVTLGYNAETAKLVGSGWGQRTTALADENGILDGVTAPLKLALPREFAAVMMFNAVDAATVRLRDGAYTNMNDDGDEYPTIGERYMGLKKSVGTLTSVEKEDNKDTYRIEMTMTADNKADSTNVGTALSPNYQTTFTAVAKDYSAMKYNTVKVLFKEKDKVYGVYATKDNEEQNGLLSGLKMDGTTKVKLGGTKYDLAKTTSVYIDGNVAYKTASANVAAEGVVTTDATKAEMTVGGTPVPVEATISDFVTAYGDGATNKYEDVKYLQGTEVSLLATDGTAKYSILNVKTYEVGQVTYVGSDYVNVSTKKGATIGGNVKRSDDDFNYPTDLKKDDYVVVSAAGNYADGKGLVEKAEVVTGKVEGTNNTDKVQIDGTWYTMAGKGAAAVAVPNMSAKVALILVNGYAYYKDTVTAGTEDIALLVEAGTSGGVSSKYEARLIFADGTDKVVEIKKNWEDDSSKGSIGTIKIDTTPQLVSYDVSKDVYTLTKVNAADTAGYDAFASITADVKVDGSVQATAGSITVENTAESLSKTATKMYFESTGVVFVRYDAGSSNDDPSFKVVTGKTASSYDKVIDSAQAVVSTKNNAYYAQVAVLDFKASKTGGSSDTNYAVALGDSVTRKIDNTTYTVVKGWNGSEEIEFKTEDSMTIKKGSIFEYSVDSSDAYDITVRVAYKDTTSGTQGNAQGAGLYVATYDEGTGDIDLQTNGAAADSRYTVSGKNTTNVDSKDTVVLFVNSDDGVGVPTGEIRLANFYDDNTVAAADNTPNVLIFADEDSDDYITVIVVDVNNDYTAW